jgi:predicted DNA-binding helix-hairpin-helix protein
MDILKKTQILANAGKYDSCGPKMCEVSVNEGLGGIYHAKAEHKNCRLFKTLMSNDCKFDCKYCANANGCTKKKAKYEPKELAKVFNHIQTKLDVQGLFLSSAVSANPDKITEEMIESVKILREQYKFKGYVHFKVLPGTSYELIKQASEISHRMSINLEAPNKTAMHELSTCKEYKVDILRRQSWIARLAKKEGVLQGGQTTQIILNKLSTDKDVLKMMNWEYENLDLKRMYFSAFRPVLGTALQNEPAEPLSRQNHLYNVDFLLRQYNFKAKEFYSIMDSGMLPKEDPKLALAKLNLENDKALDINEANYEELIRIPGIGPKTARLIVQKTQHEKNNITKYEQLHELGGWIKHAKPFISILGKRQTMLGEFSV